MRLIPVLASSSAMLLPPIASAQPVSGLYVGAGAGGNFMQNETATTIGATTFVSVTSSSINSAVSRTTFRNRLPYDPGAVAVGSVGYGLGNGLRVEIEGDYRYNSQSHSTRNEQKFGAMANVFYDLDVGSPNVFPYFGLGAGYMWTDRGYANGRTSSFAYQAIAGVATPISWVPGLSATLEYRFMGLTDAQHSQSLTANGVAGVQQLAPKFSDDFNHSILLGIRYSFNNPAAAAPVTASLVPAVPQASRSYLIFFDWDRADLTDRARQIIAEAAQNTTRIQFTRIEVQGNADSSGAPAYNQRLSLRRAQTVAAELVRDGVSANAIDIQAFGDTRPLVQTAAGVRESQNRRVAIVVR